MTNHHLLTGSSWHHDGATALCATVNVGTGNAGVNCPGCAELATFTPPMVDAPLPAVGLVVPDGAADDAGAAPVVKVLHAV